MNIGNLISCPDCGASVSRKAHSCPHCGRRMRNMPIDFLVGALMGVILFCICAPMVLFFGKIATPARQSDDELKQRMEERSREAYFKQLNEAQKAKKK
jgi:hypothetical protein